MTKGGKKIDVWVSLRPTKLLIGRYYVMINLDKVSTVDSNIFVEREEIYFAD